MIESQPEAPWTPSHNSRPSWHSITSSVDSNAAFTTDGVPPTLDIEDDGEDIASHAAVRPTHIALQRESLGGDEKDEKVVVRDWDEAVQVNGEAVMPVQKEGHGSPVKAARGLASSMSSSVERPDSTTKHQIPPNSIEVASASPTTPSIVISRPSSPRVVEDLQSSFVDISLSTKLPPSRSRSQSRSSSPSPRSQIPRRIYVPTSTTAPHVQLVQGPPTPGANSNGRPSYDTSVTSSRPSESDDPGEATEERDLSTHSLHSAAMSPSAASPVYPLAASTSTSATTPKVKYKRCSGGISTQDVISRTRPTHLPPKSKQEDQKHMHDWEEMMQRSRLADAQRRQKVLERRLAREKEVEESAGQWEREVLPDWKAAVRDPRLKRLWWDGIPTKLRGRIWYLTLGNALALSKDAYRSCLSRAKRAISSNSFPAESMRQIESDIIITLPALHLFHPETGPMYQDLKDLLCAWLVARSDEGLSYVRGVSNVAAMFLINMPADQAFVAMRNMLERHCMRSFYGGVGSKDDVEAYYRIFDTILADVMPKVYFNFKQHAISPAHYLPEWIAPMFLEHLPFEACSRIWDVLILEGDAFLFRTAIAILGVMEARLFFPDRKELMEVLHGENKAALDVARRSGPALVVDLGARYEQYGLTEESLWERMEQTEWKESTWSRLITRELPDI